MTREIRPFLNRVAMLYNSGRTGEAWEIYNKQYLQNPDAFNYPDKVRYCWCINNLFIINEPDIRVIIENAQTIFEIVNQEDFNEFCVFTLLHFLKLS